MVRVESRVFRVAGGRLVEDRELYARVPDAGSFRVNWPGGFLHNYPPIPWDAQVGPRSEGPWWVGSDDDKYRGGFWDSLAGSYGPIGPGSNAWNPRLRTFGSPLTEYDQSGQAWSPGGGWLPAVTRCLEALTNAVVAPDYLYRNAAGRKIDRPHWVDDPMQLSKPPGTVDSLDDANALLPLGRRLDAFTFWRSLVADAILWGQGGFVYVEAADKQPLAGSLQLLNPFMFYTGETGRVVLDRFSDDPLETDFDGRFQLNGSTWRVAVMHGQVPVHDGWPTGVLLKHFNTFRLGAKLGRYIDEFYTAGIPSGYLQVSTPNFGEVVDDPDNPGSMIAEQDLLKRRWMDAHGSGRRSVAVLNSTVSYTPISVNPLDADAAKLAAVANREVALAFGLDPIWVGEGASGMSYNNETDRNQGLVKFTAIGWAEPFIRLLQALMPYGSRISINWDEWARTDHDANSPQILAQLAAGVITRREARQRLGYEPWEGPDPAWNEEVSDGQSA